MAKLPNNIPFEQWVDHIFDHPVKKNAWYSRVNADWWDTEHLPTQAVSHLTRVFENPLTVLAKFSDDQIGQGLWYLLSASASNYAHSLKDRKVDLAKRLRCINAMFVTFQQLCTQRCLTTWDVEREPKKRANTQLDSVCYMWWDIVPLGGKPDGDDHIKLNAQILNVMTKELALNSEACQQSALHGLGHWYSYYPTQVEIVIDHYLAHSLKLRPELLDYAQKAQSRLCTVSRGQVPFLKSRATLCVTQI